MARNVVSALLYPLLYFIHFILNFTPNENSCVSETQIERSVLIGGQVKTWGSFAKKSDFACS